MNLPEVVTGVLRGDDAAACLDAGAATLAEISPDLVVPNDSDSARSSGRDKSGRVRDIGSSTYG